ncbi:hypothetical protein DSD19_06375 [Rhodovulum sp. BSW8]|uniref:hypothetical protein n=1 Tax=Rhodovulum sp. BSW8 TaxID=2259645 RepID=UPI000DE34B30|nr:hypothetical protein [Rhodovulum sp. BSW8]RBO54083.1 hypothetical protein DSD19_06375 [Rhodovulum sp. BSW8]
MKLKASPESIRKIRKSAAENLRKAQRELTAAGDHGTAYQVETILKRLDERRKMDADAVEREAREQRAIRKSLGLSS